MATNMIVRSLCFFTSPNDWDRRSS